MSWQASGYVKSLLVSSTGKKINRGEKLVLLLLADYTDPGTGVAWPSIDTLAQEGLYGRRQILRLVESLESKGFLDIERSEGRKTNRYKICGLMTKCHHKKNSSNSDISSRNSDILSSNSDIAVSPEPNSHQKQEPRAKPSLESLFDKAYSSYPRHVAKRAAEKAWLSACGRRTAEQSVNDFEEFVYNQIMVFSRVCFRAKKEKQFIPHMATWLNQDRFMDDPSEWAVSGNGVNGNGNGHKKLSASAERILHNAEAFGFPVADAASTLRGSDLLVQGSNGKVGDRLLVERTPTLQREGIPRHSETAPRPPAK